MTFELDGPIVLAGAGKMGTALLAGWLANGLKSDQVVVQEPRIEGEAAQLVRDHSLHAVAQIETLDRRPAVIVVAVKPQVLDSVFPGLAKLAGPRTVTLSIAAGKLIAEFEKYLGASASVVRAMPNTPAAIGRGISGAVANAHVTQTQKALCDTLLGATGEVVWLDDEVSMDAVTAVSGSGPAYVFLLAETLAEAGRAAGLPPDLAMQLARATISGSGELMRQSPLDAATLRRNVTSPGGTTAAALDVLMRDQQGLKSLMTDAVLAAQKRARELAK